MSKAMTVPLIALMIKNRMAIRAIFFLVKAMDKKKITFPVKNKTQYNRIERMLTNEPAPSWPTVSL